MQPARASEGACQDDGPAAVVARVAAVLLDAMTKEGGRRMKHAQMVARRTKLLKLARDLARSGQHQDHHSIVAELHAAGDFFEAQRCLTDRAICAQLDRLCAMASGRSSGGPLRTFLAQFREPEPNR